MNIYEYIEDGIYVDVSEREGSMILGFVGLRKGIVSRWSTESKELYPYLCECEAIQIAKVFADDLAVFCDCQNAASAEGVFYIPRQRNGLAHRTARLKKNFIDREIINKFLESNQIQLGAINFNFPLAMAG